MAIAAGGSHSLALVAVRPWLAGLLPSREGPFQFTLFGEDDTAYRIDYSTDLAAWQPLTNVVCTNGEATISDFDAVGSPERFYRAVLQP